MPLIRKERAGSAPGHTWENDGDVIEVTDLALVADLLQIPGFSEAAPQGAAEELAPDEPAEVVEAPVRRRAARKVAPDLIEE